MQTLLNVTKRIVTTVEEHTRFGGLGSVIAEIMAEHNITLPFYRLCLPEFIDHVGSQKELRKFHGIDAENIEKYVSRVLGSVPVSELPHMRNNEQTG